MHTLTASMWSHAQNNQSEQPVSAVLHLLRMSQNLFHSPSLSMYALVVYKVEKTHSQVQHVFVVVNTVPSVERLKCCHYLYYKSMVTYVWLFSLTFKLLILHC